MVRVHSSTVTKMTWGKHFFSFLKNWLLSVIEKDSINSEFKMNWWARQVAHTFNPSTPEAEAKAEAD